MSAIEDALEKLHQAEQAGASEISFTHAELAALIDAATAITHLASAYRRRSDRKAPLTLAPFASQGRSAREIIGAAVAAGITSLSQLSKAAGKNHAYLHQFMHRHIPQELPERVREALAAELRVSPDELRNK